MTCTDDVQSEGDALLSSGEQLDKEATTMVTAKAGCWNTEERDATKHGKTLSMENIPMKDCRSLQHFIFVEIHVKDLT